MEPKLQPIADTAVSLVVQPTYARRFLSFFTEGVTLPIQTGGTLKEMICDQLGVAETYLEGRIQTIFLNFKAVDKPEKALVKDGATIALSAAMPGLAGATMRKGGTYSVLRSSISFAEADGDIEQGRGRITLKLLNVIARELGPPLLANGVCVMGEKVTSFLTKQNSDLKNDDCEVSINGKKSSWEQLVETDLSGQLVLLKVTPY
jgi:hypothetical protein